MTTYRYARFVARNSLAKMIIIVLVSAGTIAPSRAFGKSARTATRNSMSVPPMLMAKSFVQEIAGYSMTDLQTLSN